MRAKVRHRPSRAIRAAYHVLSVAGPGPTPEPLTPLKPAATSAASSCDCVTSFRGGPSRFCASPQLSQDWPPTITGTWCHAPLRSSRSG